MCECVCVCERVCVCVCEWVSECTCSVSLTSLSFACFCFSNCSLIFAFSFLALYRINYMLIMKTLKHIEGQYFYTSAKLTSNSFIKVAMSPKNSSI